MYITHSHNTTVTHIAKKCLTHADEILVDKKSPHESLIHVDEILCPRVTWEDHCHKLQASLWLVVWCLMWCEWSDDFLWRLGSAACHPTVPPCISRMMWQHYHSPRWGANHHCYTWMDDVGNTGSPPQSHHPSAGTSRCAILDMACQTLSPYTSVCT